VSVVVTNASVELTQLGSLGSPYEFGHRLVVAQDRRGRKPGRGPQVAELVSAEASGGKYVVEYTFSKPDEQSAKGLYVAAAMKPSADGFYNRLFSVTGQWNIADAALAAGPVKACVNSFKVL
jgi:hypothetical protein